MKKIILLSLSVLSNSALASDLPACPTTEDMVSIMVKEAGGEPSSEQVAATLKKNLNNCYGNSIFLDGQNYIGEWKNGNMHGQGTSIDSNNNKYVGQFKDNTKDGRGSITFANGSSYSGNWKKNEPYGQGIFISKTGENYSGEFRGIHWTGLGTLTKVDGTKIKGLWYKSKYVPALCEEIGLEINTSEHRQCIIKYMDTINTEK